MKIAISLPDDLARQVDSCARRLRVPRSRLLADGARLVVAKYAVPDATASWNAALDAGGQPGEETAPLRARSKRIVRAASGKW
jgi:predicted transcriptional regulator